MGVITFILAKLFYPVLFTGSATYFAFRLGSELPLAARLAGQSIGMGYNYFKVTLRVTFFIFHRPNFIVFHTWVQASQWDYLLVPQDHAAGSRIHERIPSQRLKGEEAILKNSAWAWYWSTQR